MTTQSPTEFIDALTDAAKKACVVRQVGRGSFGEGKADSKLPDGRTVACTYSVSTSLYGREQARASFTIDGKRASKEQISIALGGRTKESVAEMNPQLRAAFEAQAPQLEADFIAYVTKWFNHQFAKFEGQIPAYPSSSKVDQYTYKSIQQLRQYCDVVDGPDPKPWNRNSILKLNVKRLADIAKRYAEDAAVQWFYKTNEKLGKLDDAELVADHNGYVVVKGVRDGKTVLLRQQVVGKTNSHGTYFHQFPALLYVDGKKTTEAAYKKLFGDKE